MHRRGVVCRRSPGDGEFAVVGLLGKAVLHHHHGGHHVGALDVGDVIALNPQQRHGQVQGFLQLLERLRTDCQVAGPPGLVQFQRVLGILADGGHQRGLVAALRHPDVHLGSPEAAQPFGQLGRVAGRHRDKDFARQPALAVAVLTVNLLEQVLHQVGGGGVFHFFHNPAPLAADPAAPDVEDLDRGLEFVLVQGEDIGIGVFGEHYCVAFKDFPQGGDVIPEPRRTLVVESGHCFGHLFFEF